MPYIIIHVHYTYYIVICHTVKYMYILHTITSHNASAYSTGQRQCQNEMSLNAFAAQTQTHLHSPRPSNGLGMGLDYLGPHPLMNAFACEKQTRLQQKQTMFHFDVASGWYCTCTCTSYYIIMQALLKYYKCIMAFFCLMG